MKKYIFMFLLTMMMISCESLDEETEQNDYYQDGYKRDSKW